MVTQMKGDVLALLDSENDGVRTHAIKFTESLIITLSPRTMDSDVPKRQEGDISLDKVPKDHPYIRCGMTACCSDARWTSVTCPVFLQMSCVTRGRWRWTNS